MGDSYRPGRSDRDRPPPLADRMTFASGSGDSYRSGGPQRQQGPASNRSEFTFQSDHAAPQFPPTGPTNAGPPWKRNRGGAPTRDSRRGDYPESSHPRGKNFAQGFRGGTFRKPAPHQRALLRQRNDASPEHTMGVSDGPNRFLNVEDLSDDEEADMDVESDKSVGDDSEAHGQDGNQKVARTQMINRADGDSIPKWSNPDPYTVLPPPEETTGKKTDFVKLIRKAKNQLAEKAAGHNAVAANDDFISFGDDGADKEFGVQTHEGDKTIHRQRHGNGLRILEDDESIPRPRQGKASAQRSVQGSMNDLAYIDSFIKGPQGAKRTAEAAGLPNQPQYSTFALKRKHGGFETGIVHTWLPLSDSEATPWLSTSRPYAHLARDPLKWLHNEILDFYDFVAPKPSEHHARNQLVDRVNDALGTRRFPQEPGRVLCFGSFPAGLYLPTADMDLVYTSDRHYNGGPPVIDTSLKGAHKNLLHKAARRLVDTRMCTKYPVIIAAAKVPIIKFTDSVTGLEVDVSFENLSGIQAQATFAQWKLEYPDMVFMVALLKQFLAMRGLNEVHHGGIGGFSIICLIVSYIQHARKPENLGECFLGFLKYYGEDFDLAKKRIQMYPPAIVDKTPEGIDGRAEKKKGLSIQDPNRPDNNISGGSHKAKDAFMAFALAHRTFQDRITASKNGQDIGPSILSCVLGGNYSSYLEQRQHLASLK